MKTKRKAKQEQGKCPECGGQLDYQEGEMHDEQYCYTVSCTNCDWSGLEWYILTFEEHTTK